MARKKKTAFQYIFSIAIDELKTLGTLYILESIMSEPRSEQNTVLLSAAFSGVCSRVAMEPLDVLKIRLQLQLEAITRVSEFKIYVRLYKLLCIYIYI